MTFNDWYLPAKDELNELYNNKDAIGGFSAYYWSSTEYSDVPAVVAWVHSFSDGIQGFGIKDDVYSVRCIQAF